jgi:hypothetical protein
MRRIGDECTLRLDERPEARRRGVERLREHPELLRSLRDRRARREVARPEPARRVLEVGDGSRHRAGEAEADEEHERDHDDRKRTERDPDPPDPGVDVGGRVGHPQRTHD